MYNITSLREIQELSFILVHGGAVAEVSKSFLDLTGYEAGDFLLKNIIEVFRTLRAGPGFNLESIAEVPDYFLFTKSLEVRFVSIEIIKEADRQVYIIREKPSSRLEDRCGYLYQLLSDNLAGVAVFSVPDLALLKASSIYLGYFDAPYNTPEKMYGKQMYECIAGWDDGFAEKIVRNVILTGKTEYIREYSYSKYTKGVTYWDAAVTPIKEDGTVKYIVINAQDVTERVLYKQELEEKNRIIEQQKKEMDIVLDNMSDGFTIIDKDGCFIKLNKTARQWLQHIKVDKLEDIMVPFKYYDMDGKELTYSELPGSLILRGQKVDEYDMVIKSEEIESYISTSGKPIYDENGNFIMGILNSRDITGSVKQSRIIKEQKEQLEAIVNNMEDTLMAFDKDGRYILRNKASVSIANRDSYKAVGDVYRPGMYFDSQGNEIALEGIPGFRVLNGEKLTDMTVTVKAPEGVKYLSVNGTPLFDCSGNLRMGILCVRDITKSISQNQIIKQQKEVLEAILDNMEEALCVFDKNGKYIIMNKVAKKFFPSAFDKVGDSYRQTDFTDMDGNKIEIGDIPSFHVMSRQAFKEKVMCYEIDGQKHYEILSGTPIFDEKGDLLYGIITSRNITELIKSQQTLKEIQEQLLKSEREKNESLEKAIEMKDEFLSLISHEFRTPLNVINTAVQAMNFICGGELSDKAKEFMGTIRQNTYRQLRLVNNLLDITRADAGRIKIHKKNIDIVFLTRAITESVYSYASQKGVRLTFLSTMASSIIGIDDEKYERIILNLLSNAIKFTPEGKSIVVNLHSIKNKICIEVRDNGIGMPEEKLNVIFERFGQVDSSLSRQAEGAGIGLSLVKRFVEALGGSISVKSRIGLGSTFSILLPKERALEEHDENHMADLMDNHLVQVTTVEFSDIYL